MQPVPQCSPINSYLEHAKEIREAIGRVLESGRYILGVEVEQFEAEFSGWLGTSGAVGVGNGTDALSIALKAVGVEQGDMVITVSHTAVATVAAIQAIGAVPLLVDVDPETFTIEAGRVEEAVIAFQKQANRRIGAIVPVHLYGHPAPMPALEKISNHYNIPIVEDCAQAHGASIDGRIVGTIGQAAAFSFYPTKNLGAIGDAGIVTASDSRILGRCRSLREYGWEERFVSKVVGRNSRLDELQAAILRVKLPFLEQDTGRRIAIAKCYDDSISDAPVSAPHVTKNARHVFHQYVIRSRYRDNLRTWLLERDIHTAIHYPLPVHLQPAYQSGKAITFGNLENTEILSREILSLPMFPELTTNQVERVCESLEAWQSHE